MDLVKHHMSCGLSLCCFELQRSRLKQVSLEGSRPRKTNYSIVYIRVFELVFESETAKFEMRFILTFPHAFGILSKEIAVSYAFMEFPKLLGFAGCKDCTIRRQRQCVLARISPGNRCPWSR